MSGPVPDLGAYFQLYWLELAHNLLTGPIPDLSAHIRLQWLDLSNNLLTGPVPPALADLPDLTDLYLAGNRLGGCIPPALHRTPYSDLDRLALPDCAAPTPTVTPAPATTQRGALVALYHATGGPNWRHNNNWLSDKPLDAWYGVRAHPNGDVIELNLGNNRLTGEIPDLGALAELKWLALFGNYLTGPVPDLSANARLRTLHISDNRFSGPIPDLSAFNDLRFLALAQNELTGPVPDLSANPNLEVLLLSQNELTGPVPDLSANPRLKWLYLDNNQLTGPVPDLSALVNLTHLHLSHNRLTGPVPDLSALTQLWELYLSHNALTGSFPDLSALVELRELHLNSNRLSGEIPDLSALTHLDDLYLGFNRLSGPFPDLSALTNLETVYLRDNRLSGPVLDLGNLVNLRVLLSKNNDLSGPLPDLGALLNLAILDLAGNRFCLPAGAGLSHPSHDVADHLRSLDLPACSAAELALVLPAPRNLTATVANGRVDLSWDAAANAAAYELQVWDSLDRRWASAGGLLTATSYSHPVLGDGRNYYFQVRARNAAGVRGPWTERVHAIIVPQRFPPPPRSLGLDILYQKYMVVVDGIFVAAPSDVSDEQMIQAGEVLTSMLSARPDLLQAMADLGTSIFIYFETLPHGGKGFFNFSANLSPNDRHCGTAIHEYAHLVHDELRERPGGPDFDARLLAAYNAALDVDLYGDAYASSNMFEYWAETVAFWFQGQVPLHKAAYGTLSEYDPQGAQLVEEVFGAAAVPAYCKPPRPG
ncbi:MAG: fibronectin type III domain-containing protein [Caldilineaceae bacterium]|nr:fibronectin type III domain-containing protein [Caldilineaceae bacterium]